MLCLPKYTISTILVTSNENEAIKNLCSFPFGSIKELSMRTGLLLLINPNFPEGSPCYKPTLNFIQFDWSAYLPFKVQQARLSQSWLAFKATPKGQSIRRSRTVEVVKLWVNTCSFEVGSLGMADDVMEWFKKLFYCSGR